MGKIKAICISRKKGIVKKSVQSAQFKIGHGIVGDAHAGNWHRQISLLMKESIDEMRLKIPNLADGAFAENIVTEGLNLKTVNIGDTLQIGEDILLEITQIGKKCHTACAIRTLSGDCIMPNEGIFCKVVSGGAVKVGSPIIEHRSQPVLV